MAELSLEALAARIAAVEQKLAEQSPAPPAARKKDWRKVVGLFDDDPEFVEAVVVEGRAIREADRAAAREGRAE